MSTPCLGPAAVGWLAAAAALLPRPAAGAAAPVFDAGFWRDWGDGRAEVASYDLTFVRYGAPRSGVAVAVFVTETFNLKSQVKADTDRCCGKDEAPVLKLNLMRDFPTGIYDYNLMTSAFVLLAGHGALRPGDPTKVSFSSQEWCGHVYRR